MTRNSSTALRGVRLLLGLVVAAALLALSAQPAHADHPDNPGSIPPHGQPYGMSYGEWGAAWWQWAGAFPLGADPITEGDGPVEFGDADDQPAGPVWFLAGNFGGPVERSLTVPAGKALFLPLVNFVFWSPEDCEFLKLTRCRATDLKHKLREIQDQTVDLEMTVDGVDYVGLDAYTGLSKAFPLSITAGDLFNAFGYEPGVRDPSVSGGHWMMLGPLAPGEHTLHWGGASTAPETAGGKPQDVTYHITVE